MAQTHVMKFVHKGRTHPQNTGIRTFPHHTYGVSRQSPDHFQQSHTLINHGYHYDHEHKPQFEYHSQKKSQALAHQHPYEVKVKKEDHIHHTLHLNPHRFHLKKGRLTQFWDKNGWINGVYPVSGFQRSQRSRSINNRDRDQKIKSQKSKIEYDSHIIKKTTIHPSYYHTLQDLMSQRVRIRIRRNKEAEKQIPLTQRTFSQMKVGEFQGENIKTKMAQTTKQWHPTLKQKKMSADLSFREERVLRDQKKFDKGTDQLQEWQRKTCNSKWCYKAPKEDLFNNLQTEQIV